MISMEKPTVLVRSVLAKCASTTSNEDLRRRLESIGDQIEAGETLYRDRGAQGEFYTLDLTAQVGNVSGKEMIWLYDQKLSREGDGARPIYDTIRASSKHGICPLCGHRDVSQLDHYLAKAKHALFTITPLNLIPACGACNKAKLAAQATSAGDQTLHPYFDNVNDAVWLQSQVIETTPPALLFAPSPPAAWPEVKRLRVQTHFETFKLGTLYAVNAAQALSQISHRLARLAESDGALGVQAHLLSEAISYRNANPNSWQTAMYTSLADSAWFCNGGHLEIE